MKQIGKKKYRRNFNDNRVVYSYSTRNKSEILKMSDRNGVIKTQKHNDKLISKLKTTTINNHPKQNFMLITCQ